jgi:hypothetical protein
MAPGAGRHRLVVMLSEATPAFTLASEHERGLTYRMELVDAGRRTTQNL